MTSFDLRPCATVAVQLGVGLWKLDALIALEQNRIDALLKKDYERWADCLSANLVYVHSAGIVETKQQNLDGLTSGFYGYESFEWCDRDVRVSGDMAVLQGTIKWQLWFDNSPEQEPMNAAALAIYEKENGEWKLVNWQTTRLP